MFAEDQKLQIKIDKKRKEKTEVTTNIKGLEKRVQDVVKERNELKREMTSIDASMPLINQIEDDKKTKESQKKKKLRMKAIRMTLKTPKLFSRWKKMIWRKKSLNWIPS
jgi:chemotaxis regulatin CheY-phosphate phosphatase CheZ